MCDRDRGVDHCCGCTNDISKVNEENTVDNDDCDAENEMDSWEQFFGTSTDLMPSIMDAMDALLDSKVAKRSYQVENFPNLSANVQKILANLPPPDDDCNNDLLDGETMNFGAKRNSLRMRNSVFYASLTPKLKHQQHQKNKSNESLDIISPNVQKMLSNLPDTELVLVPNGTETTTGSAAIKQQDRELFSDTTCTLTLSNHYDSGIRENLNRRYTELNNNLNNSNDSSRPLGNYMQKSCGIASRTPVGRKNMGKYLQIPSESTNSTLSSELSRPVSLTSLGSCSSSSSSGLHQQGSAYTASAESLDSDNEPNGSQGSADSGIAESTTMGADMRVLHEVVDTEAIYVKDLDHVIKGYLEPWRNDPQCPLHQHLIHLFSNLEAIHDFNRQFLDHLRSVKLDATQIANVFLQHDSGFSIYTEYCTNYPRTMNILTDLTRDEEMAKLFRQRQQALHHALPLGSYLLKPVQRILKYHLFLQRLSKQCDEEHKYAVDLALTTMTAVATHINSMKRKHEHAVRVQEIQSQLYGWNGKALTALGELIAEGNFRVGGARGRRHVFLFDKLLMMAKSKPDGALGYKTHIMCSNLMLVEQVRGEPLSFHILPFDNPRNQYTLRARNTQHKREWTLQIKRVILENYNAVIPNHARQLVMQLGQDVQESEHCDTSSPVKQHTTPQYLERRGRYRKTGDFSTTRRAASHDRAFPSLGKWRRQSDPSGCNQYKGGRKKSPKAKKSDSSVFYTDLSDSENCVGMMGASMDSLNVIEEHRPAKDLYNKENADSETVEVKHTIAQVVTDLLLQNEDFQKVLQRQRRNLKGSHSCYGNKDNWNKDDEGIPNKSDSLPRSFQLNVNTNSDVTICDTDKEYDYSITTCESSTSLQECSVESLENCYEVDDEEEYPDHKIYRKSTMRFSLLQRFRALLSEDSKSNLPTYKQGSKSMGAKLANPDYADPQKILLVTTDNEPRIANLTECAGAQSMDDLEHFELSRCNIDMTINEMEVLKELDRRLQLQLHHHGATLSTSQTQTHNLCSESLRSPTNSKPYDYRADSIVSSQNSENDSSYYESLLDKRLTEEERKMEKSDSFRSTNNESKPLILKKPNIKRPNKAPPPIPAKPKFLLHKSLPYSNVNSSNSIPLSNYSLESNQKGWVKTIIDRFE